MKTIEYDIQKCTDETVFEGRDAILDIQASGRYWRTSALRSIDLIRAEEGGGAHLIRCISEKEADEYDMLCALSDALKDRGKLITYNGHAFDLPHLRAKYRAYGLMDPFTDKSFEDLFLSLRGLTARFGIPSRRIRDMADFLSLPDELCDAERTLYLTGLLRYEALFDGSCAIECVTADDERLVFTLSAPKPFPREVSFHDAVFHVSFQKGSLIRLSARAEDGTLRFYHTDIQNYAYLPLEGYAIHRSAAVFVDQSRREKATRENCFHRVRLTPAFVENRASCEAYLASVLAYLK